MTISISTLTPEQRLICLCMHVEMPQEHRVEAIRILQSETLDWEYITGALQQSHVRALAYTNLLALPEVTLDPALKARFRDYITQTKWRNLRIKGELTNVLRALSEHGIEVVLFKGLLLAEASYGSIALREFGDLDILIHREQAADARTALAPLGYQPHYTFEELKRLRFKVDLLHHTGGGVDIDIHWQLVEDWRNMLGRIDPFKAYTVQTQWNGYTVRTFETEFLFLFLCLHGYRHLWERLSWLVDLHEFMRRHPELNWERIDTMARSFRMMEIVDVGLLLVRNLLGASLPTSVQARLENAPKLQALTPLVYGVLFPEKSKLNIYPRPLDDYYRFQVALATPFMKARILFTLLIGRVHWKPTAADRAWVSLPPQLEFLYAVLRPIRLLIHYGGSHLRQFRHVVSRAKPSS